MKTVLRSSIISSVKKFAPEVSKSMVEFEEKYGKALDTSSDVKLSNLKSYIEFHIDESLSSVVTRMIFESVLSDMKIHISDTI